MKVKYVEWDEPLWLNEQGEIAGNSIVRALPEDIVKWYRSKTPALNHLSDEDILDYFMMNYWATFKEYDE